MLRQPHRHPLYRLQEPLRVSGEGPCICAGETIPGVRLEILPYVLNISEFLGSAKLDAAGNVIEQNRTAHQWRRVKYSYMGFSKPYFINELDN